MRLYRKKLNYWLKTLKPDIVISTLGRELDFLTQLDDGSIKIGESHIAKPYTRNLHLMEQRPRAGAFLGRRLGDVRVRVP